MNPLKVLLSLILISSACLAQEKEEPSTLSKVLLWVPNRVVDFIDIFRADIGVGPALGAVVRVTDYGKIGARVVTPVSLRVGLFGKDWPFLIEHSNELGIGPLYLESGERKVTPLEVGAGFDFFLFGAYAGISIDEAADFLSGIIGEDISDDDW